MKTADRLRIRQPLGLVICLAWLTAAHGQTLQRAPVTAVPLSPTVQSQLRSPLTAPSFNNIHVTVLGLTSARIDWGPSSSPGVAHYQILRGGAVVADVPATVLTYTDPALRDGASYTYSIKALGAPTTLQVIPGAAPPGANQQPVTNQNPLLGQSNQVTITTPALLPPVSVTAAVDPANAAVIRVSWPQAPGAQTYNVIRNGRFLLRSAVAIADSVPGPGWYTYTIQSVAAEPGGDGISNGSRSVTVHSGPFTVLAFGDSVMWGQGLAEPHKFINLLGSWLTGQLGPVQIRSLAHSGANTVPDAHDPPTQVPQMESVAAANLMANMTSGSRTLGEVPNTYPTVTFQALTLGPKIVDPGNVDLIVMDGCINDESVKTILDPTMPDDVLRATSGTYCGPVMYGLMTRVHALYPRAKIVITGYFPIASSASDLTFLAALATGTGLQAGGIVGGTALPALAPLAGLPIDPLTGAVIGAVAGAFGGNAASQSYRVTAADHSTVFNDTSKNSLLSDVNQLNSAAQADIARLAVAPYQAQNSYASPTTWLWLIPTDAVPPKDEMFAQRQQICTTNRGSMDDLKYAQCVLASAGHPNILGAQQYATAIESQLGSFVTEWRRTLAATQTGQ